MKDQAIAKRRGRGRPPGAKEAIGSRKTRSDVVRLDASREGWSAKGHTTVIKYGTKFASIRHLFHRPEKFYASVKIGNTLVNSKEFRWPYQAHNALVELMDRSDSHDFAVLKRRRASKVIAIKNVNNVLPNRLRARLRRFLQTKGHKKRGRTMDMVGCNVHQLRRHLLNQLPVGAQLLDYTIDHIFPLFLYDMESEESQRRATHYSNLQPLFASANSRKGNKLPSLVDANKVERWAWPDNVSPAQLA